MEPAKKRRISRLGIVVVAAILVEIISIAQYKRVKSAMEDEMGVRARVVLGAMGAEVGHMMELTEATMRENLWKVQQDLEHPDSAFTSLVYLVDDNPHVIGGFLTFVPDYYPSKGRLFEPYAKKSDGVITLSQFAGEDHDYTQNDKRIADHVFLLRIDVSVLPLVDRVQLHVATQPFQTEFLDLLLAHIHQIEHLQLVLIEFDTERDRHFHLRLLRETAYRVRVRIDDIMALESHLETA